MKSIVILFLLLSSPLALASSVVDFTVRGQDGAVEGYIDVNEGGKIVTYWFDAMDIRVWRKKGSVSRIALYDLELKADPEDVKINAFSKGMIRVESIETANASPPDQFLFQGTGSLSLIK